MADPTIARLSSTVIWDARGLSKMFGLIGACLAMYHTTKPENKFKVKALLISAGLTSIIAGVTEPIEFSFMFVAPILFVIHAILSGLGMVALNIFNVRAIGPNGLIDFLLYNLPLGIEKTSWPMYIVIGLVQFAVYYVIFRFLIVKLKLKTPGREDTNESVKLYTKKDYKEKVAKGEDSKLQLGKIIVAALGGKENIEKVDNCFTRLRLIIVDPSKIDKQSLKETGASGVVIKGENVQVVYGLTVTKMRKLVDKELGLINE
jgi:PTS system maltose and glucose-specific IIC component